MSLFPFNLPWARNTKQQSDAGTRIGRGFVAIETFDDPAALSAAGVLAATTLADGATTTVTTGITNPDYPRSLSIVANAAQTGNVVITGTNRAGKVITETLVANGTTAVNGTKAFATVTQVVLPARADVGRTISVGAGNKLGLANKLAVNTVLATYHDGTLEGTAATVATNADDLESNTILLDTALDGSEVVALYVA